MSSIYRQWLAAGMLLLAGCGGTGKGTRVVLVTVDTLRWDTFAGEGERASDMPRTLAFAEQGLIFEQFYAATPVTQPTHATLFTARHPWQHGVVRNGMPLSPEDVTVAESLRDAGFETAAVVASFPLHRKMGFDQGFDRYHDAFDHRLGSQTTWNGVDMGGDRFYSLSDSVTQHALEQIDAARDEKQFFWFHYFDPHAPYGDAAPGQVAHPVPFPRVIAEVRSQSPRMHATLSEARRCYNADATALDASLAKLFARLAADAEDFDTHIVLVSDHGESFGGDGYLGHGRHLSPEQVHVPCFVRSPLVSPARRADVAGSLDIPATLLALAQVDDPPAGGRNLLLTPVDGQPAAFGMRVKREPSFPNPRMDGVEEPLRANRYYLVEAGAMITGDGAEVLREDDPTRAVDADLAAHAKRAFQAFESQAEGAHLDASSLDPETAAALRALGYIE